MSKHTPGPWVTCSYNPLIFGAQQGDGVEPIGFVYGPPCPEQSELGRRALARAKLAAAAPDLFAALLPIAESGEISAEIIRNAKDAIAKARQE